MRRTLTAMRGTAQQMKEAEGTLGGDGVVTTPSILLIVPHFGTRPPYLPLVLKSMAHNPDVRWLLITDRPVVGAPPNVAVHVCEFRDLVTRIQGCFDFPIALERPYKLCDFRPAYGEIFQREIAGYDFWGHCDLDVIFGRILEHLPAEAFGTDKILFQGNFALYRNSPDAAAWFRHEIDGISYREIMTNPGAMHFDEWAGIYHIVRELKVPYWQQDRIFDLSFSMYRTRADVPPGKDPRRYAWEDGEMCEYHIGRGHLRRRTALLVHLQKRTMRAPPPDVVHADRYWILPNRFAVQNRVSQWHVRAARIPMGHEILPFYWRRIQRSVRRRAARRAAEK